MGEKMQRTHLRIQEMTQALTATLMDVAAWGLCIGLLAIVFYFLILLPRAREHAAAQEEVQQAKRAQRYGRRGPSLREQAEPRTKIVYIQEGHIASRSFMTDSEREFFRHLLLALPYYHVFPQVAHSAILDSERGLPKKLETYVRGQFDRFVADFVICHPDIFEVVAVVELDDPSHDAKQKQDARRDSILADHGYKTIRFDVRSWPSLQAIREALPYTEGDTFAKPPVEVVHGNPHGKAWEELF
jgi:hypothetical protein